MKAFLEYVARSLVDNPDAVEVEIEEDGRALTVGVGYSPSADVILRGANEDKPCELIRQGCWSRGVQNVKVTYTAGYASDAIPDDVQQVACWLSWFLFTEPERFAEASSAKGGVGFSFSKEMPPSILACFNALRVY